MAVGTVGQTGRVGGARRRGARGPSLRLSGTSVPESATVGTAIGALSVVNPGAGIWTFSKTADPDGKFSLSGATLSLAATVDYETKTSHSVTLRATDGTTTISLTTSIAVTNALEGTLSLSAATFVEGAVAGTAIGTFAGFDLGAGETMVSITPADGRLALASAGAALVVGLSASSAGTIAATFTTSAGRALSRDITVSAAAGPYLLLETGGRLLLESGGAFLLG